MRTKEEINRAILALRYRGDATSLVMATTLQSGLSEQQVFQKYVIESAETDRDESVFFAARDAARYAAGLLELSELVPEIECLPAEKLLEFAISVDAAMVCISKSDFSELLATIHRLEKKVDMLCEKKESESGYKQTPVFDKNDFIIQEEAVKYIGCSKVTIQSWTKKGFVKGYRKGSHVYYSKSELDVSPAVQNFRNFK